MKSYQKKCVVCGVYLKSLLGNRALYCDECRDEKEKERHRKWYQENSEKVKEQQKKYRQEKKEKEKARVRACRKKFFENEKKRVKYVKENKKDIKNSRELGVPIEMIREVYNKVGTLKKMEETLCK